MSELFLLSEGQMGRLEPFFPRSHGVPRVDDRRVLSGIVHVIRNGLRWRDAPEGDGPHKTIYNRFVRWSEMGVFARILIELAKGGGGTDEVMIDVEPVVRHRSEDRWRVHLKAHRTAASLVERGLFRDFLGEARAA